MKTPVDHAQREHALCSPSAAHRWIRCPASVILSAGDPPRPGGPAAERGTRAHEAAQLALETGFTVSELVERRRYAETDPTWIAAVQSYVDYVLYVGASGYKLDVEQRVTVGGYVSGTPDLVAHSDPTGFGGLIVVDLKTGRNEVHACENEQLMLYAAGAATALKAADDERVTLTIVQPFLGPPRSWSTTAGECRKLAVEAVGAAAYIHDKVARGETVTKATPGDWCTYCPAAHKCPALAKDFDDVSLEAMALTVDAAPPVSPALGDVLRKHRRVLQYIEAVREAAKAEAWAGRPPAGWKLVQGASRREWSPEADEQTVARTLAGVAVEPYRRELLSVAQAEKAMGKRQFADVCADMVTVRHNAPSLVPESDKRPAYTPDDPTCFDDYTPNEDHQ
jgi:hypothetical protein